MPRMAGCHSLALLAYRARPPFALSLLDGEAPRPQRTNLRGRIAPYMTADPSSGATPRALPHVFDPEFDDRYERLLLGRDPVEIDQPELADVIGGRTVLVTGAGGSIGSRLSLLLARLAPARLVLLDSSEHNLFTINEILRQHAPGTTRQLALCDVRAPDDAADCSGNPEPSHRDYIQRQFAAGIAGSGFRHPADR